MFVVEKNGMFLNLVRVFGRKQKVLWTKFWLDVSYFSYCEAEDIAKQLKGKVTQL